MSRFHYTCPSCSAHLSSARAAPPGRSLRCPRCGVEFVAPAGSVSPAPPLPAHPPPTAAMKPPQKSLRATGWRATPTAGLWVVGGVGLALVLGVVLGLAAGGPVNGSPAAAIARTPTLPSSALTVPSPPPCPATTPAPATPAATKDTTPLPKDLIVGKWKGVLRVREWRHETFPVLVEFAGDGTFSMTMLAVPKEQCEQPPRGVHFDGTYTFRGEDVLDVRLRVPPELEQRPCRVEASTSRVSFLDRDLMLVTNVVTDQKMELRRVERCD
jgi:DNA-directed RNA polymerase subunit RPC12/RpoP